MIKPNSALIISYINISVNNTEKQLLSVKRYERGTAYLYIYPADVRKDHVKKR